MSAVPSTDRLLSFAEVAQFCNVPERMGRRIVAERRVPVVKVGRYVRVRQSDLEAYLRAETMPAVR